MNRRSPAWRRKMLLGLHLTVGVNAIGGCIYGLRGGPNVPIEWLEDSPFRSYRGPALILGISVGGSSLTGAPARWRRDPHGRQLSLAASALLAGWIAAWSPSSAIAAAEAELSRHFDP